MLQAHIHLGNITAILSFCLSFFGPAFMGDINYVYQPIHAAWYAAFAPILWCYSFAWIIFKAHIGQPGKLSTFYKKYYQCEIF